MRLGWWGSDPQLAQFFRIVFSVQDLPFAAALQNGSLLGGDAGLDDLVDLLFVVHEIRKDLDDLLADGVGLLVYFHFVQSLDGGHDLVRDLNDFFMTHLHSRKTRSLRE